MRNPGDPASGLACLPGPHGEPQGHDRDARVQGVGQHHTSLSRLMVHEASGKEAPALAGGPCTGLQACPPAFLALIGVTVDEWQRLVSSCEAALHA